MFSRPPLRIVLPAMLVLAAALAGARPAAAGPPLICHRFEIGTAASLPWGQGDGWDAAVPGYDVSRLTGDVLRLLSPETPVLARMETLRRATIYASRDRGVSGSLLAAVLGRALDTAASGRADALAWFDAGYLVESYRQASFIHRWNMLSGRAQAEWTMTAEPGALDGYLWIRRALSLAGANAEMEFAASLMKEGPAGRDHLRRALGGAQEGSLLARNVLAHDGRAKSLVELKARAGG